MMGVVGIGTFVGRLGRLFLTYILIYQQIFLGCVWAQGGLRVIQADLEAFERSLGSTGLSKPLREPKIVFSSVPVEVKEAFKGCHVVVRAEGEKVQALWRRGDHFYAFQHPELSSCVRLHQDKGKNLLYIKSLLSGSGYQDFVIGLESSEGILIEDSIQLKQLIVQAPIILNQAMGFLNLQGTLEGIDVEKLDIYGQFKMESESTLNVKTLHLHHGTFINQGTVKFKEGGKASLGGNDFINDHEIVGVKNLTFEKGGMLDQRLARSQITLEEGRFLYEGLRLNFHEHSSLSASSILMKTSENLSSLPRMTGEHLHLEAPYLEEGILKRVATFKTLKLISTRAGLTFSAPLSGISLLTLEAPQVTNKGGLWTKGDLYIKAPTIVNEAPLLSVNGKVVLAGNVQHTQGLLGACKGVEIIGDKHTLLGEVHPHTALTVKSQQGFTYDPLKFKTENVLKLVFQESTSLPQAIDTPGVLILEGPAVTLKGSVQAQHLEARTPLLRIEALSLRASLKAWGQVSVVSHGFTAEQGVEVQEDFKIASSGPVLLKGSIVSEKSLVLEAPQVTNKGGLGAKGDLYIKAPTIVNEAPLLSENGKVVLEGNVQHTQGMLGACKGVEIIGDKHTLLGEIHPHTALTVKSRQGFIYNPLKFKTKNVLKLVFQEPTIVPQAVDTPGVLILEGPAVTLKGSVQAQHLEAHTPLLKIEAPSLVCSLKAWGQVDVVASQFTAGEGIEVMKDLKITSPGPIVLKGAVVSNESITLVGQKIEAQQELFAHKKLNVESTGDITFKERAVGIESLTLKVGGSLSYKDAGPAITPQTSGLQTQKILTISTNQPKLCLKQPLHVVGKLEAKAPMIYLQASLKADSGIHLEAPLYPDRWSLHHYADLESAQGDIVLKGRVRHNLGGHIRTPHKVKIEGTNHDVSSQISAKEGIEIHSTQVNDLRYTKESFKTLGLLKLIFNQGGSLIHPLKVAGAVEIKVLPTKVSQTLAVLTKIKTGSDLTFTTPGHVIEVGSLSLPSIKVVCGGRFAVSTAKIFDLIQGGVSSGKSFLVKADQSILLGRLKTTEKGYTAYPIRNEGSQLAISSDQQEGNGSYLVSNDWMVLETQAYDNYGGDVVVTQGDLKMTAPHHWTTHSGTTDVWQGNLFLTTNVFYHYILVDKKIGDTLHPSYWVDYLLLASLRPSQMSVNGDIYFNVKGGQNLSSVIRASRNIVGESLIKNEELLCYLNTAIKAQASDFVRGKRFYFNQFTGHDAVYLPAKKIYQVPCPSWWEAVPEGAIRLNDFQQHILMVGPKALVNGHQSIEFGSSPDNLSLSGVFIGRQIAVQFEKDLTFKTIKGAFKKEVTPFQSVMNMTLLSQPSSLVKIDTTGKKGSLLVPVVPLKYPLEEELKSMKRLILGPKGSETLPLILPSFLEARVLIDAFQQNLGYVPLTPECPDYLSLHRKVIQNGADLWPYLQPLLAQPQLLGLAETAPSQALVEKGLSLLQGLTPSLSQEIKLKLREPILFYVPQYYGIYKGLAAYLYTPLSHHDPRKCERIAQMWAQELYLMGQEGSHLSLDKSRLMAEDKGVITAKTLGLEKEIQYNTQTQQYVATPGGEIVGDTWAIHAENVISKLGLIDVKHLWLDVLNHYYTSGVTKADVLVCDVKHVTLDREQRSWTVTYTIETTTKKKKSFGGSKKKTHSESHTVTLTESYPAHLSGLLAFEKFIGKEGDATSWFPERKAGREIKDFSVYAGTVRAGQEGWSPQIQEVLELRPKEDMSSRFSETSCKGYEKKGMIIESTVVPAEVIMEGPLHPVCEGDIVMVSPKITSSSDHVVFEAKREIDLQEHSVFNQEDFHYFSRKNKVYEVERWQEVRTPIRITMPGKPVFRAGQEIKGEVSQIQGCDEPIYDAPRLSLSRPILRDVSHERLIGMISKGVKGLDILAMVGTGILLFNPATTWVAIGLEIAKDSTLAAIGGAMLTSVASQAVGSTVAHRGNLKQVGRDLTSSQFAKSFMISVASAGILQGLKGPLDLPSQPRGFEQHLKVNAVRSAVSAGLNMTIGGMKPEDALVSAARMIVAGTLGGLGANEIAEVYRDGQLDYLTHKLTHALLGAGMGSILSEDAVRGAVSGAVGGFFGEIAGEALVDRLEDKSLTTVLGEMDSTVMKAQLAAAVATMLAGQDIGIATFTAENAIRNNSYVKVLIETAKAVGVASKIVKEGTKVALKKGVEVAAKSGAKEGTKTSRQVAKLAEKVAEKTGGIKTPAKGDGYVIRIPNGKRDILVRIMEKGGERSTSYYRVTMNEKGGVTRMGEISSNRHLTHIELHKNSLDEIMNIIKILKD